MNNVRQYERVNGMPVKELCRKGGFTLRGRNIDQSIVQLGLVHERDLLPDKARGIGQASVLGDDAFGDAQSHCYSLMGEFAYVFEA